MKTKSREKPVKIPNIPKHVLDQFLEFKIDLSEIYNLKKVDDRFLWNRDQRERYRINVWIEYEKDYHGDSITGNRISHSFIVDFNRKEMDLKEIVL